MLIVYRIYITTAKIRKNTDIEKNCMLNLPPAAVSRPRCEHHCNCRKKVIGWQFDKKIVSLQFCKWLRWHEN